CARRLDYSSAYANARFDVW
nr:immunoglobulin heavy chain junction region [Macaca mulatta]